MLCTPIPATGLCRAYPDYAGQASTGPGGPGFSPVQQASASREESNEVHLIVLETLPELRCARHPVSW